MASEVLGVHIEKKNDGVLQAIKYVRGKLELLDQRHLPHVSEYIDIPTAEAAWHAIKDMVVRGAPAIAIAAALALAAELVSSPPETPDAKSTGAYIVERLQYLVSSRPTAVNLGEAAKQLSEVTRTAADQPEASAQSVIDAFVVSAEQMLVDDVAANRAIGANGAEAIVKAATKKEKLRVMTHCNTGSLATAAYGTALGVIRSLHAAGKLETAIATETRPYNQGSRLTAYELVYEKIPAILVADSAAAAFGATRGVDAIVVGADRIAANGDTANKIGTYSLAIGAKYHGVPFFVAAPVTSIDLDIHSGAEIHIEQRDPKELTHANGGRGDPIAPAGIDVWNPSFDVTPADLIAGIITEKGVIYKADGATEFDIPAFLARVAPAPPAQNPPTLATEAGDVKPLFVGFNPETLVDYIATKTPDLATRLGGKPTDWKVREVGDGNLNLVFIVEGPQWTCVLKQSLPYVRCVGESWPLTVDRSWFEALALKEEGRLVPQHVPEVYHVDRSRALFVMRYLEPPHIILRKGLIAGHVYPLLADHVSTFLARTLFSTSLLALDTAQHKAAVAKFVVNVELCRLTEQVIFTEPYAQAANNHWTSPQLDAEAAALRSDVPLKVAITALKKKFTEQAEALVHGDLHTGSIMVTDTSTQMIDPEFAFYGPMGFDIGAFLANLILAYYSQDGHATSPGARNDCKYWIAKTIIETWALFAEKFVDLWSKFVSLESPGDLTPTLLFGTGDRTLAEYQKAFLGDLFQDSLGFAGAKIVRRIVGIAHVEDLESIADPDVRASCEKKALAFGKVLLKERSQFESIQQVVKALEPKG